MIKGFVLALYAILMVAVFKNAHYLEGMLPEGRAWMAIFGAVFILSFLSYFITKNRGAMIPISTLAPIALGGVFVPLNCFFSAMVASTAYFLSDSLVRAMQKA